MQISASRERAPVERFLRRHGVAGQAVVVRTRRNGADWFVAVLGSHRDRDSARAAVARLPAALRRDGPWAKPVAEVLEAAVP